MTSTKLYNRRSLAVAYLEAQPKYTEGFIDLDEPYSAYNEALKVRRRRFLEGLEKLFGLGLSKDEVPSGIDGRAILMLFRSTARNCLTTRPSSFLEAGLLIRALERAGQAVPVMASLEHTSELHAQLWEAHLDTMELLLGILLGEHADATFTDGDLLAIGVDVTGTA